MMRSVSSSPFVRDEMMLKDPRNAITRYYALAY
jgi:hypothetical protein